MKRRMLTVGVGEGSLQIRLADPITLVRYVPGELGYVAITEDGLLAGENRNKVILSQHGHLAMFDLNEWQVCLE